jgi:hypothetical protein
MGKVHHYHISLNETTCGKQNYVALTVMISVLSAHVAVTKGSDV